MDKKLVGIVTIVIALCVVVIGSFFLLNNQGLKNKDSENNNSTNELTNKNSSDEEGAEQESNSNTGFDGGKVLVVYYSATNNTKGVAEKIAQNLNGDMFEIVPEDIYTSEDLNWNNPQSRVSREHDDESLRDVKLTTTTVDDWDSYDTVFIGYPIWWGVAAWPVDTFVKANNFEGKTVIPFCTSASSGLGRSGELLEEEANGGNFMEGHRFSSSATDSEITSWLDTLK